ncbi:hypothetical protein [Pontibacter chitinilyticus]|uniref:hypothetical protein n=1 Tax=Pontibacter chitinilyticus TaxID=2674989 RepID=UPI003219C059
MNNNTIPKEDGDLLVGYTNSDPAGKPLYHPAMLRLAILWAVVLAIAFGLLAYLVASGTWPIRGFGQFDSAGNGPAAFVGVVVGAALGGLIGALQGLRRMVKSGTSPQIKKNKHGSDR